MFVYVLMVCNTGTGGPLWLAADILELDNQTHSDTHNMVFRMPIRGSYGEGGFPYCTRCDLVL